MSPIVKGAKETILISQESQISLVSSVASDKISCLPTSMVGMGILRTTMTLGIQHLGSVGELEGLCLILVHFVQLF